MTQLVEEKYVEIFDGVLAELMKVVDILKQEDFINDESQLLSSIKSIFEQVVWEEEKKLEKDLRKQICQKAVHIVSHGIEEWVCDPRQVQVKAVIFLQRVKLRVKEELEKNPELRYFVINEMMKEEEGIDKKKEKEEGIDEKKEAKKDGRLVHHQYLALRQAAVTMQSYYRGNQTRKMMLLKQESARRIQSWYKGRKQHILYIELRKSVLICQKTYRACRLAQSDRKKFLVLKGAALTIQAYYKGYKTRCIYQRMKQAIVLLQSGSRGFLERRRLKKLHKAATIIQRMIRNHRHIKLVKVSLGPTLKI
ncbi:abnormal spindle-like microcephaly-associated protein homolog [Saccostrea echinata]|uniref:abnormal spindle-like microcephaly-associated protein homolog n=1 Tax=Saccostrea echinata TaxID=191078 RepID=UPI002A82EC43|nr:abnormal spindle-like microcephaly-associated protein homolog [Saccostrea echinata]